ncbi:hypothetical protein [Ornithinimicrobium cryptoxanthini]|uniref:hypothetical protein n=1 Tax=Ornithinimicrobium cryptoxanthini TaxID=2934161 RepID=UPI002118F784|nr:hypothetical protein [Ornithinimicrobium cryptoxanthini]
MAVVNVRISGEAERALDVLTADGTSTSDAVRQALVDAVGLRRRRAMLDDARLAMADPADREAMRRSMQEWADVVDPW